MSVRAQGLLSPVPWLLLAVLVAAALYLLPEQRSAVVLAALVTLAMSLACLIIILEWQKRAAPAFDLAVIDQLDGFAFEQWVIDVLQTAGVPCENIRDRGDFGVDIIAHVDGVAVGIQTKRYEAGVGNAAVQQVMAGCDYYGCDVGAVVTQSHFTRAAREQAARARMPVALIDREALGGMVEEIRRVARHREA